MSSKRNKLLILLGLLTAAVSKSHNHRFEQEFESSRTFRASTLSANSRQIIPVTESSRTSTTNYKSHLSNYNLGSNSNQKRNILSRRVIEHDYEQGPQERTRRPNQMEFSKRSGIVEEDSDEFSTEIDADKFNFESQKVKGKTMINGKNGTFFSRRSGIVVDDKQNIAPQTTTKSEASNSTVIKDITNKNSSIKNLPNTFDEKNATKTMKRRKKVLRVRVRGQKSNKTRSKSDKDSLKTIEKTKLITITTTEEPKSSNAFKDFEKTKSTTQKPKQNTKVKVPEAKSSTVVKEDSKPKASFPKLTLHSDHFQLNKSPNVTEEGALTEQKAVKSKEPKVKQFVTFYRRSGPKEEMKIDEQEKYSYPEWTSTYKSEKQNNDDNYYHLSFNFKRNQNTEPKDSLRISQTSTDQKKNIRINTNQKNFERERSEYPTEELNISSLENNADKILKEKNNAAKTNIFPNSQHEYYHPETDILYLKDDYENLAKKTDLLDDLSISDKSFLDKHQSPAVTLKRKQTKKQNEPVWKLQPLDQKFSNDEVKDINPIKKQPNKPFTDSDNANFFKSEFQDIKPKTDIDKTNYYTRSFIKLPSGDKINIDFKPFTREHFKELNVKKKPLPVQEKKKPLPVQERKKDGNYFIHMYKKVGNIENFQVQTGKMPENMSYLSSLKLSWTDDDRQARVEEAVDSRAFKPYSTEIMTSIGGSKDPIIPQPSKLLLEYTPYYTDDFISPLNSDKSHYFHSVPIMQRRKRSATVTPHVTTHFSIGNSKIQNNYTLKHNPKSKQFSKRVGLTVINPETFVQQSQSQTFEDQQNKQHGKQLPSFYSTSVESRGANKSVYDTTHIFDKYEKPSRGMKDVQVFRSYQTPNRNPKRAHNMTFFLKGKDMKMKTERVRTRRMNSLRPHSHNENNITILNNFTRPKIVSFQSTNIKEYYAKPEKENNINSSEATNFNSNMTHKNILSQQENEKDSLSKTNRKNETISKPTSTISQEIVSITTAPIVNKTEILQPQLNVELKKIVKSPINQTHAKPGIQASIAKETNNSTVSLPKIRKILKTAKNRSNHRKRNGLKNSQSRKLNETVVSQDEMNRTTIKIPTKRTKTQIEIKNLHGNKPDNLNAKPNHTSQRTADVQARRMDENLGSQRKSKTHSIKVLYSSSKISTSTTPPPIQKATAIKIKTDRRSPAASNIQSQRIGEKSHNLLKTGNVDSKQVFEESQRRNPKPTVKVKLIKKKSDSQSDIHREFPETSNTQSKQIDDNTWYYPQNYADYDNQNFEEAAYHSDENVNRKKNTNDHQKDEYFHVNNAYDTDLVGITPQVQFQRETPVSSYQSSEKHYPTYHAIPKTHFTCKGRAPGYYADLEAECQVFHMCHGDGVKHSFLCPNTTVFNQRLLVCDWHSKVLCETAETFYVVNNQLYKDIPQGKTVYNAKIKSHWISPKIQNNAKSSNSLNKKSNHNQIQVDPHINNEGGDMPLFIIKHFKEKIPNAAFGKPKSVSKSYSAVVSKQSDDIRPTFNHQAGNNYFNNNENGQTYIPPTKSQILIRNTFTDNQRALKDSWNTKEMEKNLKHELSTVPEQTYNYQEVPPQNQSPIQQNTYDAHSKTKTFIPVKNTENSYYIPNVNQNYHDDDIHVAGRQNDKVIIVNRNRLNPEYDSSESRELTDTETNIFHDSREKFKPPVTTITTQLPQNDKYIFQSDGSHLVQNNNNQGHAEVRKPQYIYPLPGIVQSNDGSTQFNYGYRIENPESINLENTHIFKLSPLTSADDFQKKFLLKTDKGKKKLPDEKIKLRIQEIKSGVDNIGLKIGKILDNSDNTFKNVRIFKLKPDSINGELEEIRLAPFTFEKQSEPRNSKLREKKREELEVKVIRDQQEDDETYLPKFSRNNSQIPRQNGLKSKNNLNLQIDADEHAHSNYRYANTKTQISTPKPMQNTTLNIPSNYKISPTYTPNKVGNINNIKQLTRYDQVIKIVPHTNMQITTNPNINKLTNLVSLHENINNNGLTGALEVENRLNNQNTEIIIPSKNSFTNKPDKTKYIPLINVDEISKQQTFISKDIKPQPEYKKEKSELFENIYIPKNLHVRGASDFTYSDKIILQGPKHSFTKTKHTELENQKLINTNFKNNNHHFDNVYKNMPVNNYNMDSFDTKFSTSHSNNPQLIPTNIPQKDFITLAEEPKSETYPSSIPTPEKNNYQYYNNINSLQPQNVVLTQHLNHQLPSECDDSQSSNSNSNLLLELGKNGPAVRFDDSKTKENSNSNTYYKPENEVKYREIGDNLASEEPLNRTPSPSKNPLSKITFKELRRPMYSYTPEKTTSKTADESVQLKSKPVRLFQLQKNARPAFVKPITAIPMISTTPEGRSNYHPPRIIKEGMPASHYQSQNWKPVNYYQNRQIRPVHHDQRQPTIHHNQERRELRPINPKQVNKMSRPVANKVKDNRGFISEPKPTPNPNKYADIEKAAEMTAMLKMNKQKEEKISHSPARTGPQGKIPNQQRQGEFVETSGNNSKNSKYSTIEREAELKAEHMIRNKNQST